MFQVSRAVPFSGAVFVKNKYSSCRVEVSSQSSTVLQMGFPLNAPPSVPLAVAGVGAAYKESSDSEDHSERIEDLLASEAEVVETDELSRRKRQFDSLNSLGTGEAFVESGALQPPQADIALAVLPVGIVGDASFDPSLKDCGVKDLVGVLADGARGLYV